MTENLANVNPQKPLIAEVSARLRNFAKRTIDKTILTFGGFVIYAQARAITEWKRGRVRRTPEDLITTTSIIGFEVSGEEGEIKTVREWPEEWFKPEKLIVTEITPNNEVKSSATDTILTGAYVGSYNLFPNVGESAGINCSAFGPDCLGTNVLWTRPCHLGQSITLQIKFLKKCTWRGSLHGRFDHDGIMRERKS